METAAFLQAIWPASGLYALALPDTIPQTTRQVFRHKIFSSHAEAISAGLYLSRQQDVYFCVHSLAEPKVWNPRKLDWRTGGLGAYETRTQRNMLAAKCLFVDIDVGSSTGKYAAQLDALQALKEFVRVTGLPAPIIVSSGYGLHVYWPFEQEVSSAQWGLLARRLKTLAAAHNFLADPARTSDAASVLRLPGTLNHKLAPRPVQVLREGRCTPVEDLAQRLDAALAQCGAEAPALAAAPRYMADLAPNTTLNALPPPGMKSLVAACQQVQYALQHAAELPEPLWYAHLSIIRHCRNGEAAAHKFSAMYPGYSHAETAGKLYHLEAQDIGPATCAKLQDLNPTGCTDCPALGRVKSPIVAARGEDYLPPPVVLPPTVRTATPVPAVQIPSAPYPYKRLASGVFIEITGKKKDDPDTATVEQVKLLDHDFFPVRRYRDPNKLTETHVWMAVLPIAGQTELHIPADAMYDTKKLGVTLSNRGVFASPSALNMVGAYMVAYIKQLQTAATADVVRNALGWNDELTEFTLPNKVLHENGTSSTPTLDPNTLRSVAAVHAAGTLAKQVETLRFFDHPQYAANQFAICAALGAPLFYMTGHHGVIVNLSGKPGASKSTTLYTGASLWGHPEKLTINGTTQGATANARDNRIMALSNLPVTVDEITRMPAKMVADMAMNITQSEGRLRLDITGAERKSAQGNKATIMLCTANTSLYSIMSADRADSTAESVRVFEIPFHVQSVHTKAQADQYLDDLKANYGHIGEQFMLYVVQHRAQVHERVRNIMRAIDARLGFTGSERFWSAAAAVSCAACEIAAELGLLPYDVRTLWGWLGREQIPSMRTAMADQYLPAVSILADYLESINGNMLVLQSGGPSGSGIHWKTNLPTVIRQPTNTQLLARHEVDKKHLWIQRKSFKDYCIRLGHNYTTIIATLIQDKILGAKPTPKILGAGTDYAKGQSICWLVNMSHRQLAGELEATTKLKTEDTGILQFPTTGAK